MTALKTLSMYIRAAKTEAEEAGIATDGMANSVSELRGKLLALTGQKVDIMEDEDTYKSTVQILRDLSQVWDDLSDTSKTNITELIGGGVRNANIIAALMGNFELVEQVLDKTATAAGSALAENEKYLDSIAGKTAQLQSAFQSFSSTAIESETIKTFLDLMIKALDAATGIVDKFGLLPSVIGTAGAAMSIFDKQSLLSPFKLDGSGGISVGMGKLDFSSASKNIEAYNTGLDSLAGKIFKVTNGHNTFSDALKDVTENAGQGASASMKAYLTSLNGASASTAGYIGYLIKQEAMTWKQVAAQAALNAVYSLAATAIAALVVGGIQYLITYQQKQIDQAKEAVSTYNDQIETAGKYKTELSDLKESLASNALSEQEALDARSRILEIEDSLISMYGREAEKLDLISLSANDAAEAIDRLATAEAGDLLRQNDSAIQKAISEMERERELTLGATIHGNIDLNNGNSAIINAIKGILEKYDGVELSSFYDAASGKNFGTINITANAAEAEEIIRNLSNDFEQLRRSMAHQGIDINSIFTNSSWDEIFDNQLNNLDAIFDKYQGIYEQQIQWKIATESFTDASGSYKTYHEVLQQVLGVQKDFQETTSDTYTTEEERANAVAESMSALNGTIQMFESMSALDGFDVGVANYIRTIIESIQNSIRSEQIRLEIGASINGTEPNEAIDNLMSVLSVMKDSNGELSASFIKAAEHGDAVERQLFNKLAAAASACGYTIDELLPVLINMGFVENDLADQTGKVVTKLKELSTSFAFIKTEGDALASALAEQGQNSTLTLEAYKELIAISDDYISCVEYENGTMQLNAEKAKELFDCKTELQIAELELQAAMDKAKWEDTAEKIAALETEMLGLEDIEGGLYDLKAESLENLKAEQKQLENNINQYSIMRAELLQMSSAYTAWQDAQGASSSGDMYDDSKTAFEQIKEGLSSGKTGKGNVKYTASVELLVPEAERGDVEGYMSTLEKYIRDDSSGVQNFVSDMISAGLMEGAEGGPATLSDAFLKDGTTIEQICEALTITPEMAKMMFGELKEYDGWEFNWSDIDFDIVSTSNKIEVLKTKIEEIRSNKSLIPSGMDEATLTGYITRLDEIQLRLNELKQMDLTVESNKLEYDSLVSEYNTIVSELSSQGIDISVSAVGDKDTREQLEEVSKTLDGIAERVDLVARKLIGDLGADSTNKKLQRTYQLLQKINDYKITGSVGGVTGGNNGAHDNPYTSDEVAAYGTMGAAGGKTLVGELGTELVVSQGRYYTVGENGAEFVNLKKGDIVFNHIDTKRILSGMSGARGFALATGNAAANISGGGGFSDELLSKNIGGYYAGLDTHSSSVSGSTFEEVYAQHQHLLALEKETQQEYFDWLKKAYKDAYEAGEIELTDFYKYSEEVFKGERDLFSDFVNDAEHEISLMENKEGSAEAVIQMYRSLMNMVHAEADAARAYGLAEDSEYIQNLQNQWWEYHDTIEDIQRDIYSQKISDYEHDIFLAEKHGGSEQEIIAYYKQMMDAAHEEAERLRAQGVSENDDYIQDLQKQWWEYHDAIEDLENDALENAKDAMKDLVDYRTDMIKQDLNNRKDALNEELSALSDFYSEQKKMLQDAHDESKYLEEQAEKRKSVNDIKMEIDRLKFDDSAWAKNRLNQLESELAAANKELSDFERDHALDQTIDLLDNQQKSQEDTIRSQIDDLEARLNDPSALYNQALSDIRDSSLALYEEMVRYNMKYGDGNQDTIKEMWMGAKEHLDTYENVFGSPYENIQMYDVSDIGFGVGEAGWRPQNNTTPHPSGEVLYTSSDGNTYRMLGNNDNTLTSTISSLSDFASAGGSMVKSVFDKIVGEVVSGVYSGITNNTNSPVISMGDVIIQGNADQSTVSELRRENRNLLTNLLKEFNKLK